MLNFFVELACLGVMVGLLPVHGVNQLNSPWIIYFLSINSYTIGLNIDNIIIIYHRVEDK